MADPMRIRAQAAGDKATVRVLMSHEMESGQRKDASGKLVGPSFVEIAKKYNGKTDYLAGQIKAGGSGVWGEIPMPPQDLPEADTKAMATWLATGAGK